MVAGTSEWKSTVDVRAKVESWSAGVPAGEKQDRKRAAPPAEPDNPSSGKQKRAHLAKDKTKGVELFIW